MKTLFYIYFFIILFSACKKEKIETVFVESLKTDTLIIRDTTLIIDTTIIRDTLFPIIHTKYEPTIVLNSITRYDYINSPTGGGYCVTVPKNGKVYEDLDLDNDSIMDIRVTAEHWFEQVSTSNPCHNYSQRKVTITQSNLQIEVTGAAYLEAVHSENIKIDTIYEGSWTSISSLYMIRHPYQYRTFNGTKYVGFRKEEKGNFYYGWIKIQREGAFKFNILEAAFNPNPNLGIRTGQLTF